MQNSSLPRRLAPIVVMASLLLASGIAHAEELPNGLQKSICQPGMQKKTSGSFVTESGGKDEFQKLVGSSNFCTNEKVTLVVGFGAYMEDDISCICTNQQELDKVGCASGKTQPTVTTIIDKSKSGCVSDVITLSKCVQDPEAAYKAACKSGQNMPIVRPANGAVPAPSSAPTPTTSAAPQPTTPAAANPSQPRQNMSDVVDTAPVPATPASSSLAPSGWTAPSASNDAEKPQSLSSLSTAWGGVALEPNHSSGGIAPDVEVHPELFGTVDNAADQPVGNNSDDTQSTKEGRVGDAATMIHTKEKSSGLDSILSMLKGTAGSSIVSSLQNLFKSLFGKKSTPASQAIQTPPPPAPSLSLTAQPSTVIRGANIVLNWTSSATLANPPCQLTQNGTVIAQGNAGTKTIPTASSTTAALTFTLMCKAAQNGQTVQQSTRVSVQ